MKVYTCMWLLCAICVAYVQNTESYSGSNATGEGGKKIEYTSKRLQYKLYNKGLSRIATAEVYPPPRATPSNGTQPIPEVICGSNSLGDTSFPADCKIYQTYNNGQTSSCSAFVIDPRVLATAGHCIFHNQRGGYVTQVDIYCGGGPVCGIAASMTAQSVWVLATNGWTGHSDSSTSQCNDAGVIVTNAVLPFTPYPFGPLNCEGANDFTVTGYPGNSPASSPECFAIGYDGCRQLTTIGTGSCTDNTDFIQADIDTCSGHSGSSMFSALNNEQGGIIGIHVAGRDSADDNPCQNFGTRIRAEGSGNSCGVELDQLVRQAKQEARVNSIIVQ